MRCKYTKEHCGHWLGFCEIGHIPKECIKKSTKRRKLEKRK